MIDGGCAGGGEAEHGCLFADSVVEILFAGVHVGWNFQGFFCFGKSADVIEVGVGDEDCFDGYPETVDFSEDDSWFVAGINQEGFFGVFVGDDRTVLLK